MLVWNTFLNDARVLNEAKTLARAGYEVRVHALALVAVTPALETLEPGLTVQRCGVGQGRRQQGGGAGRFKGLTLLLLLCARVFTMLQMGWEVLSARPHLVHAHDVNMLPLAWLASRFARVPLVYDAHEISTGREGYQSYRGLIAWLEKRIMRRAAGTITTTDARAKFFARAYGIERPLVLQNCPRRLLTVRSNRIHEQLRLSQAWPIVIYQGGLQPGRGLALLVKAAVSVPDAYFVFIGGGGLTSELKSLSRRLGLTERLHFIDTVPLADLPSYTASADIGVQPIEDTCLNHYTTDSNKLFEYVQAGLPLVASNLPEIRRVVQEHNLGLLVPPGDTAALAAALRELVADQGRRQHYAARSRKAAAVLSWESQEHGLLALYDRVLTKPASS
ncbi:glycosyltransferase family 4 protein [Stutzerimonas stutzeri]|uniref:glycosyltransferase family 4 protein n=1 Tax=Stutzerimonas stutzeri TaxID=316 RepID=UPI0018D85D72|nr:glycosyltransferase family 4 protein [Stutzerimonas stutzeri]MBH3354776.1 glycosyltransferase family 4 protein [Stutzerimonas stutzeri]